MTRRFPNWFGTLLFIPFIVLLLPFIALGVGIAFTNATISGIFQRARWLRDLRRQGRATPAAEVQHTATSGTLIVDRPGFKFKATQCWWTNESVFELAPVPVPTDADRIALCNETKETTTHEFDLWCWERYISPDTGSAILVMPPHHGEAMTAKIRERQPGLECVLSWSAIPAMRSLNQYATEQRRCTRAGDDAGPESTSDAPAA